MDGNENTVKESTEDGQVYEHVEELMDDGQKYEHNKMFEEQCGIKHETITVVSLLFINLVIHFHCLALRNCVFSTPSLRQSSERGAQFLLTRIPAMIWNLHQF